MQSARAVWPRVQIVAGRGDVVMAERRLGLGQRGPAIYLRRPRVAVVVSSPEPDYEDETSDGHSNPEREDLLSTRFALPAAVDQRATGQHDDQSHERAKQPPRAFFLHVRPVRTGRAPLIMLRTLFGL